MRGIAAQRENAKVCFYSPAKVLSESVLASIAATLEANPRHITLAAYYRLLAADLLPPDVHRALYLDGDIICTGSLEPLFALGLNGCPVGMCIEQAGSLICTYNRLGYPQHDGYFNSGVILFNLDLWRKENIRQTMIDWLAVNAKKCRLHDQDLINACLHGKIFPLDLSYNVMRASFLVFYWLEEEKNNYLAEDTQFIPKKDWPALRAACETPRLVHMLGPLKFWYRECPNPFAPVWRYFYAQSPWKGERLKSYYVACLPAKAKIKRLGRKVLERLNLIPQANPPYPEEAYKIAQGVLDRLREEDRAKR